jgi:hypothetical protein
VPELLLVRVGSVADDCGSPAASGGYNITNVGSGTVLDSVDCDTGDGAALDLYAPLGNICQQWDVTPAS